MTQSAAPLAPEPSARIDVFDPNGARVSISPADLPSAQAQGYVIADTPREAPLGLESIKAGARGALRGLSAGIADPVEVAGERLVGKLFGHPEWGSAYAAESKQLEAAHPTASVVGEGLGMVGGALAGEGLVSSGGRLAGYAGRGLGAISKIGEGAEAGAAALTGGIAARGAIGRAAAAGIGMGARGAAELGAYEGIKELSEEALGDPPLAAEKIFAAAADGALGGAMFGGVMGTGGSLVKSGARGLGGIAVDALSKNADTLQDFANEQRWRALDPLKKFSEEANARVPGGTSTVGETLGRYKVIGPDIADAVKSGEDVIGARLNAAVDEVGAKLGAITDASTGKVSYGAIDDAIESVIAPIRRKAGQEGIVRSLEDYKASLASKLVPEVAPGVSAGTEQGLRDVQITLQDALFQRKALDELVYKESKALDPNLRVGLLRDFRSKFETLIVDSFDDAAKLAGNDGAKAELLGLKRDYQALSIAQEASETNASRMATNRNLSLSDMLSGGFLSNIGSAALGPIGGAAGGIAGAALNRFGRTRGNAVAAAVADRLAAFGGKERLVARLAEAAPALEKEAVAAEGARDEVAKATAAKPEPAPVIAEPVGKPSRLAVQPTLDEATMAKLGVSDFSPDIEQLGKAVFGDKVPTAEAWEKMWKVPAGYQIKFKSFTGMKALTVEADILDAAGNTVGNFERAFHRGKDGELVVNHKYLDITRPAQGKGIGSELSQSALESYKGLGVDRVELHASLEVGPYAWARQGYQWNPGEAERMSQEAARYGSEKGLSPEDVAKLQEAIAHSPRAVSDLVEGERKVGKEFLMSSGGWYGHMPIADKAAEASAKSAESAEALQKAAEFQRAKDAIAKVDAQVEKAAKGIVQPTEGHPYRSPAKVKPLLERYEAAREQVDKASGNLQSVMRRANVESKFLPKVAAALGTGVMRAATFLSNVAPPPVMQQPMLGRPLPKRTTAAAMKDFVDIHDVANNPMATLRKFATGRIARAEVQALQIVSPELFKQLQEQTLKIVVDRQASGDPLPFQARQRMHVLLGVMTDPSQDPKMTKLLQSNLMPEGDDQGGSRPKRPVQMPDMGRTYERLEEG